MNHYDFQGRSAVITGGAQGFGYAIAERLLQGKAKVVLWDLDDAMLAEARARLEPLGHVETVSVDIADQAAVVRAMEATEKVTQSVDILVHSAGIAGQNALVADYSPEEWQRVINIDLNGAFYVNQVVVQRMIAQNYGRIVNIASIAGKEGNPTASAYSAAKAGLIALTKSLGKETATKNIAVNAITPAAAQTRILEQVSQQHIDYMLSKIPRGRFVKVDEIAAMVAWLVSEENSFTTASVFDLSGGRATY
ncbi:SDR family oxidoreductase [Herbaspirillum autotrophicum]|uniref:SDR family oxidoreductase n=1 Tax=Herbaspirillum autotrophicum TaxID=180195 RepID=UPI00067BF3F6|nr:SDR family NAD(P)-dependent oxidoreductase [Herbaspirillum autotrophicum]